MDKLNDLVELADYAIASGVYSINVKNEKILAIAEAFREMEQENILLKQGCENNPLVHELIDMQERADAAEAQLAELAKQEPVAWTSKANLDALKSEPVKTLEFMTGDKSIYSNPVPLFTRPAPAAVPVDLVPGARDLAAERQNGFYERAIGWNECRAEMLRRI